VAAGTAGAALRDEGGTAGGTKPFAGRQADDEPCGLQWEAGTGVLPAALIPDQAGPVAPATAGPLTGTVAGV
jgi:hypothetical protein